MPSKKTLKHRIKSVRTTRQVVKAMDLVATAKLQKIKVKLESTRPMFFASKRSLDNLKNCEAAAENIFVKPRDVKSTAYVVITSNRGLCGSYNVNVAEKALSHMNERPNEKIIVLGSKGREYFLRNGKNVLCTYTDISPQVDYIDYGTFMYNTNYPEDIHQEINRVLQGTEISESAFYEYAEYISRILIQLYTSGSVDEVYLAYSNFKSALSHIPCLVKVLPIGGKSKPVDKTDAMKYEPNVDHFLNHAVPAYLSAFIYGALLESSSCEQASRMISMDSATKNASEIIDTLTLTYNRKRQADITQEIIEIVGSTNVTR